MGGLDPSWQLHAPVSGGEVGLLWLAQGRVLRHGHWISCAGPVLLEDYHLVEKLSNVREQLAGVDELAEHCCPYFLSYRGHLLL